MSDVYRIRVAENRRDFSDLEKVGFSVGSPGINGRGGWGFAEQRQLRELN